MSNQQERMHVNGGKHSQHNLKFSRTKTYNHVMFQPVLVLTSLITVLEDDNILSPEQVARIYELAEDLMIDITIQIPHYVNAE